MKKLCTLALSLLLATPVFAGWGGAPAYTPPWIDKAESGGVVYLLYQFPFKLERFDLASRTWLPTIELAAPPRAMALLPDGFIVAFGSKVSRFDLNGTSEQVIANAWVDPTDIATDDGFLFVFKNRQIQSLRLSDGVQVDVYGSIGDYYTPTEVTHSSGANAFFGWDVGLSPSDIHRISYDPATGMLIDAQLSSPYHGDYPRGGRLFVNASGQRLLDRAGIAYRGNDLTYVSGLGGYVRDAMMGPTHTLLARDDAAVLLTADLREVGVAHGVGAVHGVAFAGTDAVLFGGSDGLTVTTVPKASFTPPPAVAPVSPRGVYQPKTVAISDAGRVFLFDLNGSTVHRFDVSTWSYLPSIGLTPQTDFVSLDQLNERLYVAQTGGRLSVVPSGQVQESFLANSPPNLITLGAMDSHLMVADLTGAWESHRVFNGTTGVETDWVDWNYGADQFTWDRSSRRMYFFRDGSSPNDLHYETVSSTGQITARGESPLHGGVFTEYPIRVPPSGAYALLGSGQIFDGTSLALLGSLGESMVDAAWSGSTMYTIRPSGVNGRSELTRWASSFTPVTRATIPGAPVAVFTRNGQVIAVTRQEGYVRIFGYPLALVGLNVSSMLDASREVALPGDAISWTGRVTNEGTRAAEVSTTFSFNAMPPGLTLLCELDGAPISCAAGLPVVATVNSGSSLTVQAFGTMHASQLALVAQLTASVADDRPSDNEATATVAASTRIFWGGFEAAQ